MRIICTVTNDLSYDQRMQRICHSLAGQGHSVLLVGRALPHSIPLKTNVFQQKRLRCFFNKGFLFYGEFNIRLLFFLLFSSDYHAIYSVDLDTLPAGYLASVLRRKKRIFDAHEYFTEVPEVVNRPFVKAFWEKIANWLIPKYQNAITVGGGLAELFEKQYGVKFTVIRNIARKIETPIQPWPAEKPRVIFYQGALNEGRGIECAIEAMQSIDNVQFKLAGEGDLSTQLRQLAQSLNVADKVQFLGFVEPHNLKSHTANTWVGINLLENRGLSYYYSLANKFFDYVQAGIPIITMDFPEYRALNTEFEVAILLPALSPEIVAAAISKLLNDNVLYERLQQNCLKAREVWNWEAEETKLAALNVNGHSQ